MAIDEKKIPRLKREFPLLLPPYRANLALYHSPPPESPKERAAPKEWQSFPTKFWEKSGSTAYPLLPFQDRKKGYPIKCLHCLAVPETDAKAIAKNKEWMRQLKGANICLPGGDESTYIYYFICMMADDTTNVAEPTLQQLLNCHAEAGRFIGSRLYVVAPLHALVLGGWGGDAKITTDLIEVASITEIYLGPTQVGGSTEIITFDRKVDCQFVPDGTVERHAKNFEERVLPYFDKVRLLTWHERQRSNTERTGIASYVCYQKAYVEGGVAETYYSYISITELSDDDIEGIKHDGIVAAWSQHPYVDMLDKVPDTATIMRYAMKFFDECQRK